MERWDFEPATDFGLKPRERLASLHREAGLVGSLVHLGWWALSRAYLAGFHRFTVIGRENLPSAPPFILVANHSSHLDAISLGACLPARHCHRTFPIAAGDTFFEKVGISIFAAMALNALPLWRHKASRGDLVTLRTRLAEGGCIYILFPEGTRARDGIMSGFKPGLGRLVAGTKIPVVPCHIAGAFEALPPHRSLPRPKRVRITIGKPLVFADIDDDKAGWVQVAEKTEAAVRQLVGSN
jgi:1-acyl-sn-glycerol-3-phosphate acyltransferase